MITIILILFSANNNYFNKKTEKEDIDNNALAFECVLTDESGNSELRKISTYKSENIYGVGDYLLCNFKRRYNYTKSIKRISFELFSDNVELKDAYSSTENWRVKTSDYSTFKNGKYISLSDINKDSNIEDVKFKLYIKDNTNIKDNKYDIYFKNIRIHTYSGETDNMDTKQSSLNTGEYRYYLDNGIIKFEKSDLNGCFKIINEYNCESTNCAVNMATQAFIYQNDNKNIVMIDDANDNTLFDIENGIIGIYGGYMRWLYPEKYLFLDGGKYIYLKEKNSNNYGIIDRDGNIIHEFNLGNIEALYPEGILNSVYSIENDMIVNQKDGKYGISKITSNDTIIDYVFSSVRLIVNVEYNKDTSNYSKTVSNKYFKAKQDGKWYLYSFDTKEKVINEGYDNLFVVNDKIIVAEKEKYLYIKDYSGNNIVEDKIENLSDKYLEYVCCGTNPGIEVNTKDNIITITTYENNDWAKYNKYEYNISSKVLTKKQ